MNECMNEKGECQKWGEKAKKIKKKKRPEGNKKKK
jgi:hypothetical protein